MTTEALVPAAAELAIAASGGGEIVLPRPWVCELFLPALVEFALLDDSTSGACNSTRGRDRVEPWPVEGQVLQRG